MLWKKVFHPGLELAEKFANANMLCVKLSRQRASNSKMIGGRLDSPAKRVMEATSDCTVLAVYKKGQLQTPSDSYSSESLPLAEKKKPLPEKRQDTLSRLGWPL